MLTPRIRRIYQLDPLVTPVTQLAGAYTAWDVPFGPVQNAFKTMRGTPEHLADYLRGQGLLGSQNETAALRSTDVATRTLHYEAPKNLKVNSLGFSVTTSTGTTHELLANMVTVYDSQTGLLDITLGDTVDLADLLSVHLYRTGAVQELVLASDLFPFGANTSVVLGTGTVLQFDRDYEYAPISSGTFTVDTSTKKLGKVVVAYLTPGASAPTLDPALFRSKNAYVPGKTLEYCFKVSATGFIEYIITVLD